jgi:hypothetical protein
VNKVIMNTLLHKAKTNLDGASLAVPSPGGELGAATGENRFRESTSSIPLPASHVHRTQSELQLSRDEEEAELRDLNMFYRLVNGVRERQRSFGPPKAAGFAPTRMSKVDESIDLSPVQRNAIQSLSEGRGTNDGWSITGFVPADIAPLHYINTNPDDDLDSSCNEDSDVIFSIDL